jgi:hypothetical protein
MNDWFTKDRSETADTRMQDRVFAHTTVLNPALGINVYRNAFSAPQSKEFIDTLESQLNGATQWEWNGAQVTTSDDVDLDARNAKDFKFNSEGLGPRTDENSRLYDMHNNIFNVLRACMDDYGRYWGVGVGYYEAFNFVKYEGAGTHFKIHADHGPTYVATISAVIYLNDDYEGGELSFPRFGVDLKPKVGDIAVFPSTFIYEHASQEMISGTKYSVVVMTDYHDRDGVNQRVSQTVENYKLKY